MKHPKTTKPAVEPAWMHEDLSEVVAIALEIRDGKPAEDFQPVKRQPAKEAA